MSSDEIVWQVIGQQFCSYKLKTTKEQSFCRNEHNVTGFCNRQSCPLANSQYATIRPHPETGRLYLYVKVIERAHLPSKLWERTKLPANYTAALEKIDAELTYWPKFLIHKCKQRLTRLTQVAIRMRKLLREEERLNEKLVARLAPKVRRREATRERKAEAAAKVERAIERELIERLRSGAYGENPINVEENIWKKVLKGLERAGEGSRDKDLDEGIEEEEGESLKGFEREEELEDEGEAEVEYVSGSDIEEEDDLEDIEDWLEERQHDVLASDEDSNIDDDHEISELATDDSADDVDNDGDESSEVDMGKKTTKDGDRAAGSLKRKKIAPHAPAKRRKGPQMEIEYEEELDSARPATLVQ